MAFAPRSMLFVSAEKPDRFAKALASGADMVCIDLEDAVHADNKSIARQAVVEFTASEQASRPGVLLSVRINALQTVDGLRDVHALIDANCRVDAVVLPKVEAHAQIALAQAWLNQRCDYLVALLESPLGIEQASVIAAGHQRAMGPELAALMLGGADLAAELGATFEWASLLSARARLVNAAKAAGIQAWDVPHLSLDEPDAVEQETHAVRAMGFNCKSAIHPKQLASIHRAFESSATELAWAHGVLNAAAQLTSGENGSQAVGAFRYEGKMIDEPILRRARQMLLQAGVSSQ